MGPGRRSACGTRAPRLMATVVVSPFDVANFPGGGGHFWVYMQYAQGLRRLGCEVYWLEEVRPGQAGPGGGGGRAPPPVFRGIGQVRPAGPLPLFTGRGGPGGPPALF